MANKKSQTPRKTQTTRKGKAPVRGASPSDEEAVVNLEMITEPPVEDVLVMESPAWGAPPNDEEVVLMLSVPIEPLEEEVITQPPSPCASYSSSELSSDCEDMVVVAPAAESGLKSIACLCGGTYNLKTKSKHNKTKRHLSWCALTA